MKVVLYKRLKSASYLLTKCPFIGQTNLDSTPSCGPGFISHAQHLRFFQFIFEL